LNVAKWPNAARSIDTTGVTMLATVLGDQAADLLAITAESVGGAVYGDENGRVVFRGRDWQLYPPDEPVAWTVGNHVGGDEAFNPPTQTATGVWDWDDAYFTELSPGVWEWIGV
jgi:hypothetical protein